MSVITVPVKCGSLASAALLCLAASLLTPSKAQAQFVTNSPDPFQGSLLTLQAPAAEPFLPLGYGKTFKITNIAETNNTIMGGNDIIDYSALLSGSLYTTPALTTVVRNLSLPGNFEVTLFGRTNPFETGTFSYKLDSVLFSSIINGKTLTLQLDPSQVSQGTATITPGPGIGQFTIEAPAVLFGEHSVNGGPPVSGPPFNVSVGPGVSSVPEPGFYQMTALFGVGGLLTWRRAKRRN